MVFDRHGAAVAVAQRWQPAMPEAECAKLYAACQKAVRRSFDWVDRPG